ncbi:hypothetical protein [Nocardia sp. CA-120079]|uniref:hypothetical protein n=1 Tax=Nocardia sp. CA-120079 TaxID=3239974 RepID=UPI003D97EC2B
MDIDISCPACGRMDLIQSVPAVHSDGVSTSSGMDLYSGVGIAANGLVPVFGSATVERTHTTALARSLAREPNQRPVARITVLGLLLLLPALLVVVMSIASAATSNNPEATHVGFLAGAALFVGGIAAPGLFVLGVAALRGRRNGRISRGRRNAHSVWQSAFYCHRCGSAFWPFSPAPGVPARQAFAPQHFRWFVWNAGGYANV